jgi:hypothetical protein
MSDVAETTRPADQYDFWRRRMAGEVVPIHDGEPQAGFYRSGPRWQLASGRLLVRPRMARCAAALADSGHQRADSRRALALGISKTPITHEVYKAVVAGEPVAGSA